jgi:hypothetical protein
MTLTQAALGIVHGGKDAGWKYGGRCFSMGFASTTTSF